ncbi:glycosyltransferase family 2 protein [Haloarcula marismortui]|uniref:Glycosyl transferase family protein n=1 Tax=Haloarcula marismortui ATCC 33799 TaxID=662475 RepID=M0JMM0_9EURY|nr:glycosyltransferase family 2 protein [Haloarcula californiae]EMA10261.1 glycosyl transferase family protein [Haloarcula californiae ATCC 33799]
MYHISLILFLISGCVLVHTFLIYPITLFGATTVTPNTQPSYVRNFPSVALIIAAYNEEGVIDQKIENSLELDYPTNRLNITVFSDASDDATDEIVKSYSDQGITLERIEGRVGKTECQNRIAEAVDEDIIIFSDANSMYEPDAVKKLVRSFTSNVGCVVGELRYRNNSDVEGESLYWQFESWIKRMESQFNSLISGNGSIYAVRAESYISQPPDAISDFTEPLSILQNGQTVKYAPTAVAWEDTETDIENELSRRIRIITRSWNSIVRYPDLLNPFLRPRIAYQLWSHKILRWLSPVFLVGVAIFNITLVIITSSIFYSIFLAGQILFYSLAVGGFLSEKDYLKHRTITHVPFYFVQANYGMLRGLINFIQGSNVVVWDTSDR